MPQNFFESLKTDSKLFQIIKIYPSLTWRIFGNIIRLIWHNLENMESSAWFFQMFFNWFRTDSKWSKYTHLWVGWFLDMLLSWYCKIWRRFRIFQIVSYHLKYISKGPPSHGGVYFDHLEPLRMIFKTFENIPRNVPLKILCFPDCVILGKVSLWRSSNWHRIMSLFFWSHIV